MEGRPVVFDPISWGPTGARKGCARGDRAGVAREVQARRGEAPGSRPARDSGAATGHIPSERTSELGAKFLTLR